MKNYTHILFDLDGTLTDSSEGIINCVIEAFSKFGIEIKDRNELKCFIGPPLAQTFHSYYGLDEEQTKEAIQFFRKRYEVTGLFENRLYDGIAEALSYLKSNGKTLMMATSKPYVFAEKILEHFNIRQYFDFISGATMDEKRVEKEEVIKYIIDTYPDLDRSKMLMVGDTKYDILGAKQFSIDSMGVLYGFGTKKELEDAGAEYIVATPLELKTIAGG